MKQEATAKDVYERLGLDYLGGPDTGAEEHQARAGGHTHHDVAEELLELAHSLDGAAISAEAQGLAWMARGEPLCALACQLTVYAHQQEAAIARRLAEKLNTCRCGGC